MNKKKSASKAKKAVETAPEKNTFTEEIMVEEPIMEKPVENKQPDNSWVI